MKRLGRAIYVVLWSAWLRWGRGPLSRLVNLIRPRSTTPLPRFASLEAFARWWRANTRWRPDPVFGLVDIIPSLEYAQWAFEQRGRFEEDCDGLAYVAGHCLTRVPGVDAVYIVTLAFDPFATALAPAHTTWADRIASIAHVICVFRQGNKWGVVSNSDVYAPQWSSFAEAVTQNPACAGSPILWYEVRELSLRRVAAGRVRDPESIRPA